MYQCALFDRKKLEKKTKSTRHRSSYSDGSNLFESINQPLKQTRLACILNNWEQFDLKPTEEILGLFLSKAWPQYNLFDGERWPLEGMLN